MTERDKLKQLLYMELCMKDNHFDYPKKMQVDDGFAIYDEFIYLLSKNKEESAKKLISKLKESTGFEIRYETFKRIVKMAMPGNYASYFNVPIHQVIESDATAPSIKELFYEITSFYCTDEGQKRQAEDGVDAAFDYISDPERKIDQIARYLSSDASNIAWNAFRTVMIETNQVPALKNLEARIIEIVSQKSKADARKS